MIIIKTQDLSHKNKRLNIGIFLYITFMTIIILSLSFWYPTGDDLPFFITRINVISEAIKDYGLLFVLKNKVFNLESIWCGYSTNLFYGTLFTIPFAYLHILGVESVICFKLLNASCVFISFVLTYWILNKLFSNKMENYIIATLSFMFAFMIPNLGGLLISQNIRAAMNFCLPLGMYNLYKMFESEKVELKNMIGLTLSVIINLLNHSLTTLVLVMTLFIEYIILICQKQNHKKVLNVTFKIILCAIICICICADFIFPMLEQSSLGIYVYNYGQVEINGKGNVNKLFPGSLISFPVALMANIKNPAHNNGGYLLYIVLLMFMCVSIKDKRFTIMSIGYSTLLILLGIIPLPNLFQVFQFRSRLYAILNPAYILILIYGILKATPKIKKYICISLLFLVTLNLALLSILQSPNLPVKFDKFDFGGGDYLIYNESYVREEKDDDQYWNYLCVNQREDIDKIVNTLNYEYNIKFDGISFTAPANTEIILPLTYYKGYELFEVKDDELISLGKINSYMNLGLISLDNTKNNLTGRELYVKYTGTTVQKVSQGISIISVILTSGLLCGLYIKKRKEFIL